MKVDKKFQLLVRGILNILNKTIPVVKAINGFFF